jgi:hypothetical protein
LGLIRLELGTWENKIDVMPRMLVRMPPAGKPKLLDQVREKLGVQSEGRVMRRFRDSSTPLGMTINRSGR